MNTPPPVALVTTGQDFSHAKLGNSLKHHHDQSNVVVGFNPLAPGANAVDFDSESDSDCRYDFEFD